MRVWGVTGRKNAGKTTLVTRLLAEFGRRGLSVSTVKHAHAGAEIDRPGRDSDRHREAGAAEVLLATPTRFALIREHRDGVEPPLEALLGRLAPVDLVLVEGFKQAPHPKIEVVAPEAAEPPLAGRIPGVAAIAGRCPPGLDLPAFDRDDAAGIAAFILAQEGRS